MNTSKFCQNKNFDSHQKSLISEKRGLNFWDILAYIILGLILLWLILKVLGIIKTPDILEYAPYFGIVYIAGWAMHKLYITADEVRDLKKFRDITIKEINNIKANCIRNHPAKSK